MMLTGCVDFSYRNPAKADSATASAAESPDGSQVLVTDTKDEDINKIETEEDSRTEGSPESEELSVAEETPDIKEVPDTETSSEEITSENTASETTEPVTNEATATSNPGTPQE